MADKNLFPDDKVIVTEHFDVHQDWEVPIPGFFIIAARRKIQSVADFTEEETAEFIRLLHMLRKGMKEILNIKYIYLFQAEDTSHELFHIWIFPRHAWMERFGRKVQSLRPIINYSKEHMVNDTVFREVKDAVKQMNDYMKGF
jgi:diadenosine tetraphosphate (Ap4A) HIT family hydrolase